MSIYRNFGNFRVLMLLEWALEWAQGKKNTKLLRIGVNIVFVWPTLDNMPTGHDNNGIGQLTTL